MGLLSSRRFNHSRSHHTGPDHLHLHLYHHNYDTCYNHNHNYDDDARDDIDDSGPGAPPRIDPRGLQVQNVVGVQRGHVYGVCGCGRRIRSLVLHGERVRVWWGEIVCGVGLGLVRPGADSLMTPNAKICK